MQPYIVRSTYVLLAVAVAVAQCGPALRTKRAEADESPVDKIDALTSELALLRAEIDTLRGQGAQAADNDGEPADLERAAMMARFAPRQAAWQPLRKRKLAWQPLKKRSNLVAEHMEAGGSPRFTLRFRGPHELRQEMLNTVETHLLEDLTVASQYGIDAEQLLADLNAKTSE